jgi:hypothetical protein
MAYTSIFQNPGLEPFVDRATDHPVTYPLIQDCSELAVLNRIEITFDID